MLTHVLSKKPTVNDVPLQSHSSLPGAPPPLPYIAAAPAPGSPPKGAPGTPPDKQENKKLNCVHLGCNWQWKQFVVIKMIKVQLLLQEGDDALWVSDF